MVLTQLEQMLIEKSYQGMSLYDRNLLIAEIGAKDGIGYNFITEDYILKYHKNLKTSIFAELCEKEILEGFKSELNGHTYRTNRDDQINMIGQKDWLDANPNEATVMWKTEDVGYLEHTREDWIKIYNEAFQYKKSVLYKYNVLKNTVEQTVKESDLVSIVWEQAEQE